MVKWGFGTLATLALALIAGNIYSSHSNYERDNETLNKNVDLLKNQLVLAQQDLTALNDNKLFELKTETESSFTKISNSLQSQLSSYTQTNDLRWFVLAFVLTNNAYVLETNILSSVYVYLTNRDTEMIRNYLTAKNAKNAEI